MTFFNLYSEIVTRGMRASTYEFVSLLVAQLCPTLCDLMDCSPPGSSVHGVLQVRILDGLPRPLPGDLPDPMIQYTSLESSALGGRFFSTVLPGKPLVVN